MTSRISVVPSGEHRTNRKKATSRKRRRNQNAEIDELASLVSLPTPASQLLDSDPTDSATGAHSLVPGYGSHVTPTAIDKISVLRLTTTFLKLKNFIKNTAPTSSESGDDDEREHVLSTDHFLRLMEEAMDGFMIVLDKEANILYVSETISGYVGLTQQEVIGQNLVDITHSDSAAEIADCLKPSVVSSVSIHMEQDCAYVVSQYRQFFLKFKSTVSFSKFVTHTLVQVSGNLKVKIPPLKNNRLVEVVEPSVVGFIGECRLIKSSASILEISIPHSTFTSTVTLDFQPISIEARVKEIIGYDIEDFIGVDDLDFIHPADCSRLLPAKQYLVETGHSVSPLFRFLTKSGDWIWMQIEGTLHCKTGTSIPQFYEYRARVLSQGGGRLKFIEQKEIYASPSAFDSERKRKTSSELPNSSSMSLCCMARPTGAKPIIDSLKSTRMPESVLEPMLHARSTTMRGHSELIKLLVDQNAAQAKKQLRRSSTVSSSLSLPAEAPTNVTRGSSISRSSTSSGIGYSMSPLSLQAEPVSPFSRSSESPTSYTTSPAACNNTVTYSSDGVPQSGRAISQSSVMPELPDGPFLDPMCYLADRGGLQTVAGLTGFGNTSISSRYNYSPIMSCNAIREELSPSPIPVHQTSPIGSHGSVISETSLSCDSPISDISSPPTVLSSEMGIRPCTTDSIPLSALSVLFPNSPALNFIPQASPLNDCTPNIPCNFNFSYFQSSNTCAGSLFDLDNPIPPTQTRDNTDSHSRNTGAFVSQQSLNKVICSRAPNGDIQDAVVPVLNFNSNVDIDPDSDYSSPNSHCEPAEVMVQDSMNHDPSKLASCFPDLLMYSQTRNSNSCGVSSEVQDILQQLI